MNKIVEDFIKSHSDRIGTRCGIKNDRYPCMDESLMGDDFTNTIEGFWGTLKRMIEGIYHSITSKYLQRYVDEAVYRYNTRKMSGCDCFKDMFKASIGVVDYETVKKVA